MHGPRELTIVRPKPVAATETSTRAAAELDDLYRRHVGDVYRYTYAVLGNHADAEDVTQTTFVNALRALERGETPRAASTWLIAIAQNVVRQRWRQAASRPSEVELVHDVPDVPADDDIELDELVRALQRIPPAQREALVMRELEGRSYNEISELLGLTTSALETLLFRARRSLAEELEALVTCQSAELAISKQLDGRLSRKDRRRLDEHLSECEDCARLAATAKRQRRAFKGLAVLPIPVGLALFKGAPSASAASSLPTIGVGASSSANGGVGGVGAAGVGAGGTATTAGGVAVGGSFVAVAAKVAAVIVAAVIATGAGYKGLQTILDEPAPAPAAKQKGATPPSGSNATRRATGAGATRAEQAPWARRRAAPTSKPTPSPGPAAPAGRAQVAGAHASDGDDASPATGAGPGASRSPAPAKGNGSSGTAPGNGGQADGPSPATGPTGQTSTAPKVAAPKPKPKQPKARNPKAAPKPKPEAAPKPKPAPAPPATSPAPPTGPGASNGSPPEHAGPPADPGKPEDTGKPAEAEDPGKSSGNGPTSGLEQSSGSTPPADAPAPPPSEPTSPAPSSVSTGATNSSFHLGSQHGHNQLPFHVGGQHGRNQLLPFHLGERHDAEREQHRPRLPRRRKRPRQRHGLRHRQRERPGQGQALARRSPRTRAWTWVCPRQGTDPSEASIARHATPGRTPIKREARDAGIGR